MQGDFEITVEDLSQDEIKIYVVDTEYDLQYCHLTAKNEVKLTTKSGMTQIAKLPVEGSEYLIVIIKHTRFAYKLVFIPNKVRKTIHV